MRKTISLAALALFGIASCMAQKAMKSKEQPFPAFDREAHRGGRGLMPENTIPAMLNTVNLGIETLEMDTYITADGKVVVSHDDHVNPLFTLTADGQEIPKEESLKYAWFKMNYADIAKYPIAGRFN
jgi:glycerophosphoryl diester phosphodiesterase